MSEKSRCADCDRYEHAGHNYCRMCGHHFKPGYAQNVRIAEGYDTAEKYCGYCGHERQHCNC